MRACDWTATKPREPCAQAPEFPELEQGPKDVMPAAPPYHILKKPVAAYGIGLRLKSESPPLSTCSSRVWCAGGGRGWWPRGACACAHPRGMPLSDAVLPGSRAHVC